MITYLGFNFLSKKSLKRILSQLPTHKTSLITSHLLYTLAIVNFLSQIVLETELGNASQSAVKNHLSQLKLHTQMASGKDYQKV